MSIDFHKLRVAEVKRETPDAVSVRFELPEELREAFAFRAGQHLTFRARNRRRGNPAQLFRLRGA